MFAKHRIAIHKDRATLIMPTSEAPGAACLVSIVEDNGDIHFKVRRARAGDAGVSKGWAMKDHPDCWVYDWRMTEMDVGEVTRIGRSKAEIITADPNDGSFHFMVRSEDFTPYVKKATGPRSHGTVSAEPAPAPAPRWDDVKAAVRTVNDFLASASGEFQCEVRTGGGIRITRLDVAE